MNTQRLCDLMYGNEANLKEMLFKFKDFMNDHDLEFVLLYGALLGACRNGRLLPWDIDIDIHIPFKSYEDFIDTDLFCLMRDAYKEGFIHVILGSKIEFRADNEYFKNIEIANLPKKEQWKRYLNATSVYDADKFTLYWKGSSKPDYLVENADEPVHIDCLPVIKGIHSEYIYNAPLEKVALYGETFNAPPNHLQILSTYYGENWSKVFCSFGLWMKYKESLLKGIVPQEIEDFMNKWKPLLEDGYVKMDML